MRQNFLSVVTWCLFAGLLAVAFSPKLILAQGQQAPVLVKQLAKGSVTERQNAAKLLGFVGGEAAVTALMAAMEDDNPLVRVAVVASLGQIGDKRATPALIAAMKDDFSLVSAQAITALGKMHDPAAADVLLPISEKADHPQHREALLALGEMGDPRVFNHLLAFYTSKDGQTNAVLHQQLLTMLSNYSPAKVETPLLAMLQNTNRATRLTALQIMGNPLTPTLTGATLALLKDSDANLRVMTISVLARNADPRVTDTLLIAMADQHASVRLAAMAELKIRREPRALDPLIERVQHDTDFDVRRAAAAMLGDFQDPRATEALLTALQDENVCQAAMLPLARQQEARALDPLLELAKSDNMNFRLDAITALGRYRNRRAATALLAALQDKEPRVVEAAIKSLGRSDDPRVIDALLPFLSDNSFPLKSAAIIALGNIGDAHAAPALLSILGDCLRNPGGVVTDQFKLMQMTLRALAQLGPAANGTAVVAMLQPEAGEKRHADAYTALQFISDQRAVDPLLKMLQDPAHRQQAINVFGTYHHWHEPLMNPIDDGSDPVFNAVWKLLKQRNSPNTYDCWTTDKRVVKALIGLLDDPEQNTRATAAHTLGVLADESAVEPLLKKAAQDTDQLTLVRFEDPRILDVLKEHFTDTNHNIRFNAINACALLPDAEAIATVTELVLQEKDNQQCMAAIECLGHNRDPRALAALMDLLKRDKDPGQREEIGRVLVGKNDVRAVEGLITEQQDTVEWSRSACAEALITIDDLRATPAFVAGLNDTNGRYRLRAAHWLMKQGDPRGVGAFLPLLHDEDGMTREMALIAVPDCHDPQIVPLLLEKIQQPEGPVDYWNSTLSRSQAFKLLGEIGDKGAAATLVRMLPDPDAALTLARLRDARALPVLRDMLKPSARYELKPDKQLAAAIELVKMGQADGFDFLLAATRKTDTDLRDGALLALGDLLPGEPENLCDVLAGSLTYPSALTRVLTARALTVRHNSLAVASLVDAVQHDGDPLPYALARTVLCDVTDPDMQEELRASVLPARLLDEVNSTELRVPKRAESLVILAAMRDSHAQALAETALQSEEFVLREAAVTALGKLPDNPRVQELLRAALKDTDPYLRHHAAAGLGALGNKAAIAPLTELLATEQVTIVRIAATAALKQLAGSADIPQAK